MKKNDEQLTMIDLFYMVSIAALCTIALLMSFLVRADQIGTDVVINGELVCVTEQTITYTQNRRQLLIECPVVNDLLFIDGFES